MPLILPELREPHETRPVRTAFTRLWQQLAIATNWPVLVAVLVLCMIGVVSIWANDPAKGRKQLVFMFVAFACMTAFQAVNYQKLGRYSFALYALAAMLISYTIIGSKITVPGVWRINGAYHWINFGPASLQPSELMKIGFVMVLARYLRFRSNYRTLGGLIPPFLLALFPVGMILMQPDLGTALNFIPALFALLFVAGARMKHLLAIVGMGVALLPILWLSGTDTPIFRHGPDLIRKYQRDRVYAMFNTDQRTMQETGFQQQHALIAFGSGGVTGKGYGNIPVGARVPEAHNDMIFALVGEQFGFFGAMVVIGAYLVLFVAGIEIAAATREPFGKLLAVGVVVLLAGQAFINLMVCTRIMPVTGVTLPFISYGGSSLVASFMAVGLLLNIGQNRPMVVARSSFEFDD